MSEDMESKVSGSKRQTNRNEEGNNIPLLDFKEDD